VEVSPLPLQLEITFPPLAATLHVIIKAALVRFLLINRVVLLQLLKMASVTRGYFSAGLVRWRI
jgi:hypothetical protein